MKHFYFLLLTFVCALGHAQEFIPMNSSFEGQMALSKSTGKVGIDFKDSPRGGKVFKDKLEALGYATTAAKKEAKVHLQIAGTYTVLVQGETRVIDPVAKMLSFPSRSGESGVGVTSLINAPAGSILSDQDLMSSLQQYANQLIEQGVGSPVAQSCLPGACATSEVMTQRLRLDLVKLEGGKSEKLSLTMETASSRLLPHLLLDAALMNLTTRWVD